MSTSQLQRFFSLNLPRQTLLYWLSATLLVTSLYYLLSWGSFDAFSQRLDFGKGIFPDFQIFYREQGKEFLVIKAPVIGYVYSPVFALLLVPFGMLPLSEALFGWGVLLVAATFLLARQSYIAGLPPVNTFAIPFTLVFLTSVPILHNFKWGQVSVIVTLLILSAFLSHDRDKPVLSAFLLAVAISIKYFPIVFAWYFLVRREVKYLLTLSLFLFLLLVAVPSAVLGVHDTLSFLSRLMQGAYAHQVFSGGPNSQYIVNVVSRWLAGTTHYSQSLHFIVSLVGNLVVEFNLLLVVLLVRFSIPNAGPWSLAILFLSIPLFVATSWPHYLSYLPFCQLFMCCRVLALTRHRFLPASAVFLSILLSSIGLLNTFGDRLVYSGSGALFISNLLLLVAVYILLVPPLWQAAVVKWNAVKFAQG